VPLGEGSTALSCHLLLLLLLLLLLPLLLQQPLLLPLLLAHPAAVLLPVVGEMKAVLHLKSAGRFLLLPPLLPPQTWASQHKCEPLLLLQLLLGCCWGLKPHAAPDRCHRQQRHQRQQWQPHSRPLLLPSTGWDCRTVVARGMAPLYHCQQQQGLHCQLVLL
jgi:hypothetical protein